MEKDHDSCCCPLNVDIYHAGFDPTFLYDGLHLTRNVVEVVVGHSADLNGSLHKLYPTFSVKISNLSNE